MKEKYLFIDMDGTIADYYHPSGKIILNEFESGFFINKKPITKVIEGINKCFPDNEYEKYILSASPNDGATVEKNAWLDKYFNISIEKRIFIQYPTTDKAMFLYDLIRTNKLSPSQVVLIDDHHTILKSSERLGIQVYHPSHIECMLDELNEM